MYYDAHTHLNSDQLYPDWKKHLEDFYGGGGKSLIHIGVNEKRNQRAVELAKQTHLNSNPTYATIGLHPGEISYGPIQSQAQIDQAIENIQDLYAQEKQYIVGIGECGIDSHFERNEHIEKLQIYAFERQCQLAQRLGVPIVIHSRDNFSLTYAIAKQYTDLHIYFHCRGYGPSEIALCIDTFPHLRIGFTGNITYPKAQLIRDSFDLIYQHTFGYDKGNNSVSFVLETDAPYLAPQTKRGQQNIPSYIQEVYAYISNERNIPLAQLQRHLEHTFQRLYNL